MTKQFTVNSKVKGFEMNGELEGKVAIVTGATSGIGRATALRFAVAGARVAIVGRNRRELDRVAKQIEEQNGEALSIRADVTDEKTARRIINGTVKKFRALDVLVNAAGHLATGTIENTTLTA
ncbi:MAG TPA: SDR family NAD(P)-dependent oxidoreductase, partial [Pyrinomonadaceae bacterium]|nr:SDR family NAD(P)-dependent oxidoreductase [Pyrinomonadaceae bacterium]